MSLRPLIVLAVCVPFVIGAAMRGGTDETPAAPKAAAPAPIIVPPAPRIDVGHTTGGLPGLKPEPTPKPKPKPKPKSTPTPLAVRPTPTPSRPQLTPTPTPPPRIHLPGGPHPCDPGPCTITNGGGED